MRIGVDIMGGDSPPEILFEGVYQAALELNATLFVLATPDVIQRCEKVPSIQFIPVPEFITMEEAPLAAVRKKKESSMLVGMRKLTEKELDALVSAGNTGALIASSSIFLDKLPSIDRPTLLTVLPTELGTVAMADVGGHVNVKPQHLVQFAKIGTAYLQCTLGIENPKVGLLNIGEEAIKGTTDVREAYLALQESCPNFLGNIEGLDVFRGKVDVLVTDGFTGNVFLKTAEGISSFILNYLKKEMAPEFPEALQNIRRVVEYDEYPGAIVCGVDGIVVKCHGYSTSRGMFNGIKGAIELVKNDLVNGLKAQLM